MTEDGAHNDDIFFTTVKHITLENLLAWNKCPLTLYNFLHLRAPRLYMLRSSPTQGKPGAAGTLGKTVKRETQTFNICCIQDF
jgi:hypothetical protein